VSLVAGGGRGPTPTVAEDGASAPEQAEVRVAAGEAANRSGAAPVLAGSERAAPVSVRKVVPTLTSMSTEIYLSIAGAKQSSDMSFILVPAGAVRPAEVCSRHCIVLHCGACRGELPA
jgi:hypothetical protein